MKLASEEGKQPEKKLPGGATGYRRRERGEKFEARLIGKPKPRSRENEFPNKNPGGVQIAVSISDWWKRPTQNNKNTQNVTNYIYTLGDICIDKYRQQLEALLRDKLPDRRHWKPCLIK